MEVISLRSGRRVAIRPIRADDGLRLRAAYDRLSPESKYRRFLAPKPHLTSSDTRYLVHVDGENHFALVAVSVENPELILGVARFVRSPQDRTLAELAVVVGDAFQREGLATALLTRLARAASERGIKRWRATMLTSNEAARRLVQGTAGRPVRAAHDGPVDELEFELAA
jgi:RimJ/RimL family protein N-acetyltransferase